jgi:hypothetical protein
VDAAEGKLGERRWGPANGALSDPASLRRPGSSSKEAEMKKAGGVVALVTRALFAYATIVPIFQSLLVAALILFTS